MVSPIQRTDTTYSEKSPGRLAGSTVRADARLLAAKGFTWTVYEDRTAYVGPSLIFESEKITRRVRNYPPDWTTLTDEQLLVVSSSR